MSSSTNTLDLAPELAGPSPEASAAGGGPPSAGRHTLQKMNGKEDEPKGFKRFSKRQSRSGLAAVF